MIPGQHETDDPLRRFLRDHSESAFRILVEWHSPVVYSTALRLLNGDSAAAQDVMQEVFTLFARKAHALPGVTLSAWLYRQTCRRAANHIRTESRRRNRELAASQIMDASKAPAANPGLVELQREVDTALQALPAADRDAVTLRFFDSLDYPSLGRSLGLSEEAARKRVDRALTKISQMLRRKGIPVVSGSLGSTIAAMGSTPVPAGLVSRVATQSMKALPAAGWLTLLSLLKPFASGLVATTATVATWSALSHRGAPGRESDGELAVLPSRTDTPAVVKLSPIDELIAGIKRVQSGPAHVLTAMRMEQLLNALPVDQIPAFFAAADQRLSESEKASCYERLVGRWMELDPASALTFAVDKHLNDSIGNTHGSLPVNLFEAWMRRDPAAARQWLVSSWLDEDFEFAAFQGTLRSHLGCDVADDLLRRQGIDAAFDFIQGLPDTPDRFRVVDALTGKSPWHNAWQNISKDQRLGLYRRLGGWPDEAKAKAISLQFLQKWIRETPDDLRNLDASLTPGERLTVSLNLLGVKAPVVVRHADGSADVFYPGAGDSMVSLEQAEAEILPKALADGLPRKRILREIGEQILPRQPLVESGPQPVTVWLARHQGEVDFDDVVARCAYEACASPVESGSYPSQGEGIRWAACMTDSEFRSQASRAMFRRLIARDPGKAEQFLQRQFIPADLTQELRSLLSDTP